MNAVWFQKSLLKWFDKEKRDLPWRKTKDPYRIWVSEIMLQQTQVKTVIPYYQSWMRKFPTIRKLAQAPEERVLKLWAGLGYYRRAKMLHSAAKTIVQDYRGKLPQRADELQKIPGIGRYTAGAIASIAFGEKTPLLDGNVIRVLTRFLALKQSVSKPQTTEALWQTLEKLVPRNRPGDFNEALMELGALICLPRNPLCLSCPLKKKCAAKKLGRPAAFPIKKSAPKTTRLEHIACVVQKNGRVLIQKQPPGSRWAGLWTFPFWENKKEGLRLVKKEHATPLAMIRHAYTRYTIFLEVFSARLHSSERPSFENVLSMKWVSLSDLSDVAMPSPHRIIAKKAAAAVGEEARQMTS